MVETRRGFLKAALAGGAGLAAGRAAAAEGDPAARQAIQTLSSPRGRSIR